MNLAQKAARLRAVSTLEHYFRLCYEGTGKKWTSDMSAEIEQMVDDIIEASKE